MSNIVYHYTSLKSLYEIIRKPSLLLTSLKNMNDKKEGSYSPIKFLEDFSKLKYPSNDNGRTKSIFEMLIAKVNENRKFFFKLCNKRDEPYSISFSKKSDNLAHWERYGDDMKGVCVFFDIDELKKLLFSFSPEFQIGEIIYQDFDRANYIEKALVNFYNAMFIHIDKDDNFIKILENNCCAHFAAIYQTMVYFIKNDYWSDEDEVRLLYNETDWTERKEMIKKLDGISENILNDYIQNHKYLGLDKLEFLMTTVIRPCKRLSLETIWSSKLIPEIRIGCKSSQNISDLKLFLKSNGLKNTKVSESRIEIR